MSVLMKVKYAIKSMSALRTACERLGVELDQNRIQHRVYREKPTGYAMHLPGWQYPVVVDDVTGHMTYDNHNGGWGKTEELDRVLQGYTVAHLEEEAAREGYTLERSVNDVTGEIELLMTVGTDY